ncbi:DinB family protein [Ornithinibacillus californiensis]|uniref:DinB family protein n=1 Tax=Ornithinibacillus californiensis TaxID=161536 RepID=UPI00064DAA8B|nr:DinB family protein [Ornithinibacillus californiensis]
MYKFFQYNWQVRDEWLEWCKYIPEEELSKERIGGMGNILHTLLHIIDVEYSWVRAMQGESDVTLDFDQFTTIGEVQLLSLQYREEIDHFLKNSDAFNPDEPVTASWLEADFMKDEIIHHIIAHEIHHMGQLSVWAREIGVRPVSANVVFRGLF